MLIPAWEKIAEIRACRTCGVDFSITDRDLEFYDRVSPVFAGKKEPIPAPRLCPDCRRQRRLAFRNEHKLYKRKCDLTGKDIVSVYSPESRTVVYEYVEWWGDAWDATIYGVDFDFMKPLSMQFLALNNVVPKAHVEVSESENSVYTNQAGYNKNCYFTFEAGFNEDCSYSVRIWNSRDTSDALSVKSLENCHECIDVQNSSGVFFSQSCRDCHDSQYLFDCRNCRNCIGCWNLRDKQYHILNAPVTREVFEKTLSDLREPKKRSQLQALVAQKKRDTCVYLAADHTGSENAVGDNVFNSRNVLGLDMTDCKDCRYCSVQYQAQDCMDYEYWWNESRKIYEANSVGNTASDILFSCMCYDQVSRLLYCTNCSNGTSDCFGCTGLKWKRHCILNKQYTEEKYNELVPKIIAHMRETGEWGEFFSPSLSPFGYNETVAMEYYPLTKEQALKQGFNWSDYEPPFPKVEKIVPASKLPEDIKQTPDDILNWAIECEVTKKPYRIIKQELEFYRKHNIPIPRRHPDQRHLDRLALRNPRKLHERTCDNCSKDIVTTYAPGRPERVYCQECYEREIYG